MWVPAVLIFNPIFVSALSTSKSIPIAVWVPLVAPTTSISFPLTLEVPKLAELTSKSIPISLWTAVPLPGIVLSKSTYILCAKCLIAK